MRVDVTKQIRRSGLSIYDPLDLHPDLFLDHETLERILQKKLHGLDLNYPLRTRSKILKSKVCEALGYPVPMRFLRTRPRFPGQNFDTYVQKANNLQIWNEDIAASRRYVLVRVNEHSVVTRVRVVTGEILAKLDTTGTLTQKFQARAKASVTKSVLISPMDTPRVVSQLISRRHSKWPGFLPIATLFAELRSLEGTVIVSRGRDQERHRGWALHELVSRQIGAGLARDTGQFPDLPGQLLEVKLQTAATIDLGLVCPDTRERLADFPQFRHCDVRYAVCYATLQPPEVRLDSIVLVTGAAFFSFFRRFEGRIKNAKLQIPLPSGFLDETK